MIREQTIYKCDFCEHTEVVHRPQTPPNHWWVVTVSRGFPEASIRPRGSTIHHLCPNCANKLDKVLREGWPAEPEVAS